MTSSYHPGIAAPALSALAVEIRQLDVVDIDEGTLRHFSAPYEVKLDSQITWYNPPLLVHLSGARKDRGRRGDAECGLPLVVQGRNPQRHGLSAGGNRVRAIGPALA